MYVRFYQQTPCNTLNSVVGKVNNLHVLAFDKKTGLLANYVAANGEANLTADYQTLIPLHQGQYELVAWTGNADELASAKTPKGVTKKSDVFFQLRQKQTVLSSFLILLNLSDMDLPVQDSTDSLQMLTKRKLLATWLPMTSLASQTLQ